MESQRKFAVQKPQGKKWETLAMVDNLSAGKREFSEAVRAHGRGYVRLIQVDFASEEALSNYDWRLVELHDPYKGNGRPKPTVVAGSERPAKPKKKAVRPGEKVPVPLRTWMLACLVALVVGVAWVLTYHAP
ncbi:MAG: hypothetical protein PW843_19100 [Azospirillaceae bacterium]|nr:hypothetical protein [Azospirillaceae bacterium]